MAIANGIRPSKATDNEYGGWVSPSGKFYANPEYAYHERMAGMITNRELSGYDLEMSGWVHLTEEGLPYVWAEYTQAQLDTLLDLAIAAGEGTHRCYTLMRAISNPSMYRM